MFSIKEFSEDLDLTDFYNLAEKKQYYNNCNQEVLHDNMKHLNDYKTYLLYLNDVVVGSVCLHSLEELNILGDNAYRIGVRTCSFPEFLTGDRSHKVHNYNDKPLNHLTAHILLPMCIKYCGVDTPMYISTNNNQIGSQVKVTRVWAKVMSRHGYIYDPIELDYRNNFQVFWKVNAKKWIDDLKGEVWPEAKFILEGL